MDKLNDASPCQFMKFRRKAFNEMLADISDLISGRGSSLIPFITDEAGNISDDRIDNLISELLDCLGRYNKEVNVFSNIDNDDKLREFYSCFLYCAIRGIADFEYPDIDDYIMVRPVTQFSDIIRMAKDPHTLSVSSENELKKMEFDSSCTHYMNTGFFSCCDMAYELLTGESVVGTFAPEDTAELVHPTDRMYEQLAEKSGFDSADEYIVDMLLAEAKDNGFDTIEEYEEYCRSLSEENVMTEEEEQQLEEELEYCKQVQESRDIWKKTITSAELFIERYMRYRELYFEVGRNSMTADIENMTDTFLYEHKLSAFSLEERYGMIAYRLETMEGVLKTEMRKAGCDI